MSAGKGDAPRPVNGDRYRANYDAIFGLTNANKRRKVALVNSPYPAWICRPCGFAHGRFPHRYSVSTWHEDTCGVCGRRAEVTEPRDFGHLKKWPIPQKTLDSHANICQHMPTDHATTHRSPPSWLLSTNHHHRPNITSRHGSKNHFA